MITWIIKCYSCRGGLWFLHSLLGVPSPLPQLQRCHLSSLLEPGHVACPQLFSEATVPHHYKGTKFSENEWMFRGGVQTWLQSPCSEDVPSRSGVAGAFRVKEELNCTSEVWLLCTDEVKSRQLAQTCPSEVQQH